MRLLLDTHAWLWFVLGSANLSATARALIEDHRNEKLISPASYWELGIKISTGQYTLQESFDAFLARAIAANGFGVLPIEPRHAALVSTLPFHHRDPFDRLLIAQSMAESIPIVSVDRIFDSYPVTRLW